MYSLHLQHISVWISHFQVFSSHLYVPSNLTLDSMGPEHTIAVHSQTGGQGKCHRLKYPGITLWETLPLEFPKPEFQILRDP